MNRYLLLLCLLAAILPLQAQSVTGPDGRLCVTVSAPEGRPRYSVSYDGVPLLSPSPLGLKTDIGSFADSLELSACTFASVSDNYSVPGIKTSRVAYRANQAVFTFSRGGRPVWELVFQLSDHDVAFRYHLLAPESYTKVARIEEEATGYVFPGGTTAFLSPQMGPMSGWSRTAPSYEKPYSVDEPLGGNGEGFGYVFPALFRVADKGWVLLSETGVDGRYCGSHLEGNADGSYRLAFPYPEEFNGYGSAAPAIPLPGYTPWRTLTVGPALDPIVETTVAWDVVEPLYAPSIQYEGSKGSWSWIIKMDSSITFEGQKEYIDLSAAMGWQTVLVDNWWDTQIGREGVEQLACYAASKGVRLFLWYNSNGWWNDAPQGPRDRMNRSSVRRSEMAWLQRIGAKGIKVDFFGSDKQLTLQLYEDILSDANDFGLQVIFHGCTLPRGWERMYPNFVSAEAVLASENLHFDQERCDTEAPQACLHPFLRNSVASMDFGGSALNKVYNASNDPSLPGTVRRTSDVFALATAVLFQSSVQHFALAPNNLTDAPSWAVDFLKEVPVIWDEVRFLDGYPGEYVVLARRSGSCWYVAGINAREEPLQLALNLPMFHSGEAVLYSDTPSSVTSVTLSHKPFRVTVPCNGAFVLVQ